MPLLGRLHFSHLPRIAPFYLDYLYDGSKTAPFFDLPWKLGDLINVAQTKKIPGSMDRAELVALLEEQNRGWMGGPRTMENIRRLLSPRCQAVVTGQQVGLFTGPGYAFYKALTAIRLAEALTQSGIEAVPIFWMASEDHDWEEIDHADLPDPEGNLRRFQYQVDPEWQGAPVGNLSLAPSIQPLLEEFASVLPDSEFKSELVEMAGRHYRPGNTLAKAFGGVLAELFRDMGLVVMDPSELGFKRQAVPLLEQVISNAPSLQRMLREQGQQIQAAGYSPQVQVDEESLPLFLVEKGKRRLLLRNGDGFRLKGEESSFSRKQLLSRLAESPADFSPNVLLRPLYQDLLLPTFAYVGGPAEIAYFAQVAALYRWKGQPMPAVIPRASFTVIERKVQRILEKSGLDFLDLFSGFEVCLKRVIERSLGAESAQVLDQLEQQFAHMLDNLEPALRNVDPTLVDALKNSRSKILHQVSSLRNRLISAHARQNDVLTRQLFRAFNLLYPAENYQERFINSFYFLSRYGRDFMMRLLESIDLENGDHQLFSI